MSDRQSKYIEFVEDPVPEGRKTKVWAVVNTDSGYTIGMVRWYGPWPHSSMQRWRPAVASPQHARSRRDRHSRRRRGETDRSARKQLERDALEADYQLAIEGALRAGGWLYHHDENVKLPSGTWGIAARGQAGFPDIVATHPERGLAIVIELKGWQGRLSEQQTRWLDAFEAAGLDVRRFRPADYDELLDHLLGERLLQRHRRTVGARGA